MSYKDNGETDILAIDGARGVRCIPHAIRDYFGGDEDLFDAIDTGRSTDFKDVDGNAYDVIHDNSFQYDTTGDWMKDGLYCEADGCDAELIAPDENEEEDAQ